MNNNYEMPEALTLGRAQSVILGMKMEDPQAFDAIFGQGWRTLPSDIDESDE